MLDSSAILSANILIVDDLLANVQLLEQALGSAGYNSIASTTNPFEVCDLHRKHRYDLILLDLLMPRMDGFQVMERLKELEPDGCLPVLVITAQPEHRLRALRAGARDFISKPFELAEVLVRVHNMVEVRLMDRELRGFNDTLERRLRERTAELVESHLETILTMTRAAEFKDEDTGYHVRRIGHYSRELAHVLGLGETFADEIFFASPMHDIGKMGIPDRILLKPGSFTPDEREIMKRHTSTGAQILGNSKSPYLTMGAEIALNHHERWDGGGYPSGKRGESIPLEARIVNICDIYDALRSKRPYKVALDHPQTMDIITHGDGRTQPEHFDPALLDAFRRKHESIREIFETQMA